MLGRDYRRKEQGLVLLRGSRIWLVKLCRGATLRHIEVRACTILGIRVAGLQLATCAAFAKFLTSVSDRRTCRRLRRGGSVPLTNPLMPIDATPPTTCFASLEVAMGETPCSVQLV